MAFPNPDTEAIRRCRQDRRDTLDSRAVQNPAIFIGMDNPLQCLAPFQQEKAEERIRAFLSDNIEAQRTAGFQGEIDLPSLVDSSLTLDENLGLVADAIGIDRGPGMADIVEEEVDQIERERATQEILDICQALDDAGLDGARILERLFEGEDEQVRRLLEGTEIAGGLEDIEITLDSIEDELGGTFVAGAIAECRDRLAGPDAGEVTPTQEILSELRQRFGVTAATPDQAFSELETRIRRADSRGQEAAVNRLSRAFGLQFDDVDDAIDRLRERIATARGERLRIGDIQVRRVREEVRVRIDAGGTRAEQEMFDDWQDNVERRVRRELDLNQLPAPSPWVTVGEITLRGEDLDMIDLTEGRERLGAVAEPQPLEEEQAAVEQAELPEPETDAEQLADRALELLEAV